MFFRSRSSTGPAWFSSPSTVSIESLTSLPSREPASAESRTQNWGHPNQTSQNPGGDGLDQIRFLWLQGRLAAAQQKTEEAVDALERVKSSFVNLDIPFDTALVCLDLAVLYLQQGRTAEVKELARQMVTIFRAQKVDREAIAAALLFRDAAEREAATADLARRLADYLKRARNEPGLRFEG